MFRDVSYYLIFGKPLIMYVGMLVLLSFSFTALIGFLNYNGNHKIPFRFHPIMAAVSITLALIHGILGILLYF